MIREEISLGKCQVYVNSLEQEGGGDGILSVIRMSAKTTTILYVTSYIFNIFNREKETEFGPPFCINVAINGGLSGRDWR